MIRKGLVPRLCKCALGLHSQEMEYTQSNEPSHVDLLIKCCFSQCLMWKRADEAEVRFGAKFVADCRAVLRVGVIFFTFPMFWALFDQTVSDNEFLTTHE